MSDISPDSPIFVSMITLLEAETSRRAALLRLTFRRFSELIAYHEEQLTNMEIMRRLTEEGMSEEERAVVHKVTDKDTEEREALAEEEDLFGRRYILIEAAECVERLQLESTGLSLAIRVAEAFTPCVRKTYSYAADTLVYRVLPMPPHALDCIHKNPERHLPEFMWTDVRWQAPGYQMLLEHEHMKEFQMTTLAIEATPVLCEKQKMTVIAA